MGTGGGGTNEKIEKGAEAVIFCPSIEGGMSLIAVHLEMHTRWWHTIGQVFITISDRHLYRLSNT